MLDTRFPRIEGDIGNPASFDFPVIFRTMKGIGPADAVAAHPDRPRMLAALGANAEALAAQGAVGLSTSCGFLALYQKELEALSPVPVATSALLLIKTLVGQDGRRDHRLGRKPDAGALRGGRRAGRHAGRRACRPTERLPRRSCATASRSIATRWSVRRSRRAGRWSPSIPPSTPSCSNAPTCRPTRRRSRRRSGFRCTTCSIC